MRLVMRDASVAHHQGDCTGNRFGVDVALHGVVDARQPLRREPELLGLAGGYRASLQRHGEERTDGDDGKDE